MRFRDNHFYCFFCRKEVVIPLARHDEDMLMAQKIHQSLYHQAVETYTDEEAETAREHNLG